MPFHSSFNSVYEQLIRSTVLQEKLTCARADSIPNSQSVVKDIVKQIHSASIVIADLTGNNPNVVYELGLAHALRVPTILLSQDIDSLPFDLKSYRAIQYAVDLDSTETHQARIELTRMIQGYLNEKVLFGSPVTEFLNLTVIGFTERHLPWRVSETYLSELESISGDTVEIIRRSSTNMSAAVRQLSRPEMKNLRNPEQLEKLLSSSAARLGDQAESKLHEYDRKLEDFGIHVKYSTRDLHDKLLPESTRAAFKLHIQSLDLRVDYIEFQIDKWRKLSETPGMGIAGAQIIAVLSDISKSYLAHKSTLELVVEKYSNSA